MDDSAQKVVFLDRDGTINQRAPEHEYITGLDEFHLLPEAAEGIRMLREHGYRLCVVTNQRGIARGLLTEEQLLQIHEKMRAELLWHGAELDGIYYCPHDNNSCHCRKPDIGLFQQAEHDLKIDKDRSYMIGDSESDVIAGKRYGIKTVYLGERNPCNADICAVNLREAAERIIEDEGIDYRGSRIHRQPLQ